MYRSSRQFQLPLWTILQPECFPVTRLTTIETNVEASSKNSREVVGGMVAEVAAVAMVHWPSHQLRRRRRLKARAVHTVVLDPFLTPFLSASSFPSLQIHMIRVEQEELVTDSRCRMQQHLAVDLRPYRWVELVSAKPAAVLPYAAPVISLLLLICQH